jgi:hypothetical protein
MINFLSYLGIILVLPSCFIALPTPASSTTKIYQDKVVKASCNIYVYNFIAGNIATNDSSVTFPHPSKQRILATIPAGTELIAKRTVYRRMPSEVITSLVCYSKDQNITFEVSESDISEWNLTVVNPESEQDASGNRR